MWSRAALALLLAAAPASAQPSRGTSVTGLDLMDVDVMFVGAHPDDDIGVMGTFARYLLDEGWRGTVVTLTDGEGGGNATGPEGGRALGLIRREEERRALASLGVESPRFLGYPDFYFTLSAEETAGRWGGLAACDVTREVRLRRPEVIVTMWPGPGTHGQHQMAARAATIAYARAGEADHCPEQLAAEGLKPWAPAKLYVYEGGGQPTLEVRTDDMSPRRRMRYADLKSLAIMQYRSQGYDLPQNVPVKDPQPEGFLRVASRVPVAEKEAHLLEGALLPAGTSPAGIRLGARPATFEVPRGVATTVEAVLENGAGPLRDVRLVLEAPEGWTVAGAARADEVPTGGALKARFEVTPAASAAASTTWLRLTYVAQHDGRPVRGANPVAVKPAPPVQVSFVPLGDVAGYRAFARETGTEWVVTTLPTRVPAALGRTTPVALDVANRGTSPAAGEIALELPAGVTLAEPLRYEVAAGATRRVTARLQATGAALADGRHAVRVPLRAKAGDATDAADLYVLPVARAPRVARAPVIDGDLSDLPAPQGSIGPADRWWRKAPDSPADLSADVRFAWDAQALYVGVAVKDDVVACNIPPDDVRSQLRSDAVGVTVDPSGASRDTSTTLQFAAFPCTTAGWGARGFRDADARQGPIETTAPGARVASRRTADGYTLEVALPWSAMPQKPRPGAEVGLNVVLYDGDQANARPGANISETGLAWAAFEWGGKQALPYLWPRVVLQP